VDSLTAMEGLDWMSIFFVYFGANMGGHLLARKVGKKWAGFGQMWFV